MKKKMFANLIFVSMLMVVLSCSDNPVLDTDSGNAPFITIWKTDNAGSSNDYQITIPTNGTGYDYTVDWGDGNIAEYITDALYFD